MRVIHYKRYNATFNKPRHIQIYAYIPLTLHNCSLMVSTSLINVSLEHGVPVDHTRACYTYLETAVYNNNVACMNMLIKYGADVNVDRGFPVRRACWNERVDIVDILIKAGADVNHHGSLNPAIEDAIRYGSVVMVSRLLTAGAVLPPDTIDLARRSEKDSDDKIKVLSEFI